MSRSLDGVLLAPDDTGGIRTSVGQLTIDAGRIASITPVDDRVEDVILPGFIDAHLHLPQFDCIGATGLPLLEWLDRVIFPAEVRWEDADLAGEMTTRVARDLVSFGTTGIVAYATVHHDATRAAMSALHESGMRAEVRQVLMDTGPVDLVRPAYDLLAQIRTLDPIGRVSPCVSPRFALSCSMDLLAGAATVAIERGQRLQTHFAETIPECEAVRDRFGMAYLDVYERAGMLRPGTILAHAVHVDTGDLDRLRSSGALVAHCPTANEFLGSGAMRFGAMDGSMVLVGSDVAGGPDRSMVRVVHSMRETEHRTSGLEIPPASCLHRITRGNAEALGWHDTGRLEVGAMADLVVLRPTIDWRGAPDPFGALLHAWDDRWIRETWVAGERVHVA
ncbi:MAG: amidohydrolase family protein [Phycisphaerales bacterium]|nr:amidohydrolase family protein [Phycisphaerales bacterium]